VSLFFKTVKYLVYININVTGLMQAACDVAFEYTHMRKAFGQPIGHFQVIINHKRNFEKL